MSAARPAPVLALDRDQVRLFLAIARGGSLGAAGAQLGVDVSTVSRRLDRLEVALGVHLFDRTRDGAVPTAAAAQMVPHAEEIEQRLAASVPGQTEVEGVVRVAVPPGIADAFVAPLLPELHRRHPRLRIELDASGHPDRTRRDADVALRASRPRGGDLVTTLLATAPVVPMSSPAYAAELGRLHHLGDARWIAWGPELAHIPSARWLTGFGPDVVPVLRTSHLASQIAAARGGLGVMLAAPVFTRFGLTPVAPARSLLPAWKELPVEEIWLAADRARRPEPRIAATWDFLVEQSAALVGS